MKKLKHIFKKAAVRPPKVSDEIVIKIKGKKANAAVESSDEDGFVVRNRSTLLAVTKEDYKNIHYKLNDIIYRAW